MSKDILSLYKERMKQSMTLAEPHWQRSIDNYKHYFGRLDAGTNDDSNYPFYSKMSLSLSYEVVETVLPRLIGKDPEFNFVAQEAADVKYEDLAKITVGSQYDNPKLELLGEPIYLKLMRMVKECLITGNAVGRPMWRRQTRQIAKYMATLERAGFKNEKDIQKVIQAAQKLGAEDEIKYGKEFAETPWLDDFDLTHLPFFFYFGDWIMVEPGRFRYQIERELMTIDDLEDEAKRFGYDNVVMDEIRGKHATKDTYFNPADDSPISKNFMWEYYNLFAIEDQSAFATDDEKVPLLRVDKMWDADGKVHVFVNEQWGLTGTGSSGKEGLIANAKAQGGMQKGEHKEEGIENPYDIKKPPFIHVHDVVIPHSYFSRGEIDSIKKLEDGANDLMNMRFDNLLQSMLQYWLWNPKMMSNANDEFVPIPNTTTAVKDVEKAVRVISGNDVTASAYKEADNLVASIKSIAGLNDYAQGVEGGTVAGRTYGGMRLVQEVANARFIVKSRLFEKVTLKALGYFMLEFSRQFISKDRVRRVSGEMGTTVEHKISAGDLKSIAGFMDLKVVPNSSMVIDQQAEAMRLNGVADRFATEKGAFKDIPDEVYDKFLLKFLQANGITDAIYWVRARQEARKAAKAKGETVDQGTGGTGKELLQQAMGGAMPQQPPQVGGMPMQPPQVPAQMGGLTPTMPMGNTLPIGNSEVLQSDQIAVQPNPLEQLLNAQAVS
jgi:hypothetical protein